MAKENDWEKLWAHTESAFGGKVTLLVNNAGVNPKHGWTACINIMLTGKVIIKKSRGEVSLVGQDTN